MKVVLYSRVSTDKQDYQRQVNDINSYVSKKGYEVVSSFSEKISGAKNNEDRPQLMNMISFCLSNDVDQIIISELSRLGRSTIEVLKAVQLLNDNKISLYILNLGICTLNDKQEESISSRLMITMLAEFASIERTQIRQRMSSGYSNFRANGGKVGRKEGSNESNEEMKAKHADIIKLLKQGISIRNTAKITGKANATVLMVKKKFID